MNNAQQFYLVAIVIILLGTMIYVLQPILAPFFVAALFAYLGDPAVDRFETAGINRTRSAILVFLIIGFFVLSMLLVTIPLLAHQLDILSGKLPIIIQWLRTVVVPWLQTELNFPGLSLPVADMENALSGHWGSVGQLAGKVWIKIGSSSLAFLGWIAQMSLIPIVTFYLLRDWDLLLLKVRGLIPVSHVETADVLTRECDEVLGAFLRGQLLVMIALAAIYSFGLWVLGLELAMLVGTVAGMASIVPYMGFLIGIVAAGAAAFFQFGDASVLLWVFFIFGIGQAIEGMLLTPMFVGERIGLHPVAVIFAVLAGGQLAGFVGVLMALPASAVVMVFLRHIHGSYRHSDWYNDIESGH